MTTKVRSTPAGVGVPFAEAEQAVPQRLHREELLQARVDVAGVAQVAKTHAPDGTAFTRARARNGIRGNQWVHRKKIKNDVQG